MKITHQVFCVNQLSIEEFQALELAERVINHIQETYGENCRLTSPNDGECITIDELSRVRSILSFVMRNRVVEVDVA